MGIPNVDAGRLGAANNVAVATTSTAAASSAFGSQTYVIRVAAAATCYAKVDQAPTAAATDALIAPNWPEYFVVSPGQKISIFSPTVQTVSVNELTQ